MNGFKDFFANPDTSTRLAGIGQVLMALDQGRVADVSPFLQQIEARKKNAAMQASMQDPGILGRFSPEEQKFLSTLPPEVAQGLIAERVFAKPEQQKLQTFTGPDGTVFSFDPSTGKTAPLTGAKAKPGFRQASPEEAAAYGATGGQFGPDGRFYPINPPSGFAIETGPDGQVRVVQGPGAGAGKPFTEAQSKDTVFGTRAEGALGKLESPADPMAPGSGTYADQLGSLGDTLASKIPVLGNYLTGDSYQVGETAGQEFLQAILRKDTGAAITEGEQKLYGETYLPRPGDSPARLAYKVEARRRAVEALKSGMSPAQIEAMARADAAVIGSIGDGQAPATGGGLQPGATEDGYRFKGGDPADPNNWEPM